MKKPVDNSKKKIEKADEILKNKEYQLQANDISNSIYSCSVHARRLIAYCISNAYNDKVELPMVIGDLQIGSMTMPCMKSVFSYQDFFNRLGMKNDSRQIIQVKKAVDECMRAVIGIETLDHYKKYTWFISSDINKKTGMIEMTFNPLIYKAITEWYFSTKGYSALSLELLGELSSFYAMRYYEMALSKIGNIGKNGNEQGQWFFEWTINELKTLFELQNKKSYERTENFISRIVIDPIKELNFKNKDFQIEVIKIKEGRKTVGFRFLCTAINKKMWKIEKSDTYEDKQTKAEINKLEKDISFYKMKFSKEWEAAAAAVEGQQILPFFQISKDEMILQEFLKMREEKQKLKS